MADISQTAANVIASASARRISKTAASAITAGQPVYLTSNGAVAPADANASATTANVLGIAENGGGTGQRISVITKDPSLVIGATVAIGDVLILSATAGGIAPVADLATGHFCTVLGVAISTTAINFAPVAAGAAKA
jgi:hypothetical protein